MKPLLIEAFFYFQEVLQSIISTSRRVERIQAHFWNPRFEWPFQKDARSNVRISMAIVNLLPAFGSRSLWTSFVAPTPIKSRLPVKGSNNFPFWVHANANLLTTMNQGE